MKDVVALALATAATAVSRTEVLKAMQAAGENPAALATHLLQYGQGADTRDASCSGSTLSSYEHCIVCAMPSIQKLVTELVAVKNEVWTDLKGISSQGTSICNSAAPAKRFGGTAKCCSGAADGSMYAPAGWAGCTARTFDSVGADPVAATSGAVGEADKTSHMKYNRDHGFYFEGSGNVKPSTMILDCCTASSTCRTNDASLSTALKAAVGDLNAAKETIEAALAQKKALEMRLQLVKTKQYHATEGIKKICVPAGVSSTLPAHGDTPAHIAALCPGDCQIKDIIDRQAARKVQIIAHKASVQRTHAVIARVIEWLDADDNGDGSAHIFDSNTHADAPADAVVTSIEMLESATKKATTKGAVAALSKATSLLQGIGRNSDTSGAGVSRVLELLRQIQDDFTKQIAKLEAYFNQMATEQETDLSNLRDQVVNLKAEHLQATSAEVGIKEDISEAGTKISFKSMEVNNKMSTWKVAYQGREANVKKCIDFMVIWNTSHFTANTNVLL
jgi:hypothetical protein